MFQLMLLTTIFSLFLFSMTLAGAEETVLWPPTFTHSKIVLGSFIFWNRNRINSIKCAVFATLVPD